MLIVSYTGVFVQESRIYSMISDGLQMSLSSATDKNAQSGIEILSAGEFLLSILLVISCFVDDFS